MTNTVPTIDELRAFLHKQIAECRRHRPEQVDDLLEKLHKIDETHAFIEQTVGDRAAAAWVPTAATTVDYPRCRNE
jgi:hypothetical protein